MTLACACSQQVVGNTIAALRVIPTTVLRLPLALDLTLDVNLGAGPLGRPSALPSLLSRMRHSGRPL